jgi:putative ABC transport system permease protein
VARLDADLPPGWVSTIEELVSASIAQPRFDMALLVGLALSAAVLAAVGVCGVVTYSVTRRTAEIGLRMRLGADRERTFRHVVVGSLKVWGAGVVLVGLLAASLPASRASRIDPAEALRRK